MFRHSKIMSNVYHHLTVLFPCHLPDLSVCGQAPLCLETAIQGKNEESFAGAITALKKDGGVKGGSPLACPVLITYGGCGN